MIVVVEGMDNRGKTTLVQRLAEELKLCKVATYRKPQRFADVQDYHRWLQECPYPLIVDRHPFISEIIYGSVLGRAPVITEEYAIRRCQGDIDLIIHCRPTTLPLFDDRAQMDGVIDHELQLQLYYDMLFETLPHVTYDWTNESYEEVRDAVKRYL